MNILIFTASTGGGHKRAAAAIEAKIQSTSPETTVNAVDGMKAIGKFYDKTVCKGYHIMATKTPSVYGKLYRLTDESKPIAKAVVKSNEIMATKLLEVIEKYNPDIIIINDYGSQTVQEKIDYIKGNEACNMIPAVVNDRFLVIPLVDVMQDIRAPRACRTMAEYFYPELFQ